MSMPQCGPEGGLEKTWVRRGVAKLRRDEGLRRSIAVLRRGIVHRHVFLSCFVIPLFRGLVYWTNEDI